MNAGDRYLEIDIQTNLMSWTQRLKGLVAASLRLITLNDNPYLCVSSMVKTHITTRSCTSH